MMPHRAGRWTQWVSYSRRITLLFGSWIVTDWIATSPSSLRTKWSNPGVTRASLRFWPLDCHAAYAARNDGGGGGCD